MIVTAPLETAENDRLSQCEKIISRGLTTFVEVGEALAEIRDAKLYRAAHKTFEAYCKERWDIGRSRAYQLIDQAKVATAISQATGDLSNALDISQRDTEALKADLPSATADIKARVDQGEAPEKAVAAAVETARSAKEKAKSDKLAQQAEHDKFRDDARAALPDHIKQREAAKEAAIAARSRQDANLPLDSGLSPEDRIMELEEAVRVLETENAELKAENKLYGEMRVQFEQGGFDKVIAGKDEEIRVLQTRLYSESDEKIRNLRRGDSFLKILRDQYNHFKDATIDPDTGEIEYV